MRLLTAVCTSLLCLNSASATEVSLNVTFAGPILEAMHKDIAQQFEQEHADIKIVLEPPVREYDELLQQTLRRALTGGMPDVAFFPLNRMPVLSERGLLKPMDGLIEEDPTWKDVGYSKDVLPLGQFSDHQWSIPFQLSTPVIYYNKEIVGAAGGNAFPDTWDGIVNLIGTIHRDANKIGGHIEYDLPGNTAFQALIMGDGQTMMDADKRSITFDGPEGVHAIELFQHFVDAGMVDMSRDQARQAFVAGTIGVLVSTSSVLGSLTKQIGDRFELGVAQLPISAPNGHMPVGGSGAVVLADDPAKAKAAWEYIKFVVGPVGQTISAKATGYIPLNDVAVSHADLLGDFLKVNPNNNVAIASKARAAPVFEFPGENGVRISDELRDCIQAAIGTKAPPTSTLACMRSVVERLLPQQ